MNSLTQKQIENRTAIWRVKACTPDLILGRVLGMVKTMGFRMS